ncbi:MAG: OmpA family protein [Planctomycetota bacterium]
MLRVLSLTVVVLAASLPGCVSRQTHEAKVVELEAQIAAGKSTASDYAEKLSVAEAANEDLQLKLAKAAAAGKELENALGGAKAEAGAYEAKYEKLGGALVDKLRSLPGVTVSKAGDVQATVSFALGGTEITPAAMESLQQLAKGLAAKKEGGIYVDGHSDNSPVGSLEARQKYIDNLGLSLARAAAVARVLKNAGIPAARLVVRGWGSDLPVASNDTRAGRATNRRVDITFDPALLAKEPEKAVEEKE